MVRFLGSTLPFLTDTPHPAWRVDFKLSLTSFEDCVCGVKCLIDLALSSPHPTPPRLTFVSSIGVIRRKILTSVVFT